ncbi:MAG: SurA N-terminal domain-containing protein [Sphingobacteriaceae bacterium]|nr:SurA N-terminal domain-containing protein [Sphingobacteriaceae bacterium]
MSIITQIRNKAGLMVAIIGLAILSFLLMDVFSGNGIFGGPPSNTVGEIDGDEIGVRYFETRINEAVENYKINSQQDKIDDQTLGMLRENVWNELIREKVLGTSYRQLGLAVSAEELFDMVQGTNINPSVRQAFSNPQTGEFDRAQVVQFLRNLSEQPEDVQRRWFNFEKYLKSERENQKYNNLVNKGLYVPKFFASLYNKNSTRQANGRFILMDYALIADSTVAVTEKELKAYYNKHKKDYESKDEIRSIDYLVFEVFASQDDDAKALKQVAELREQFVNATNDSLFVSLNSDLPFDDNFVAEVALVSDVQKQLFNGSLNVVSDVYREGDFYKMTKMIARMARPDSVKARHILVRINEGEAADVAKARADSLFALAKKGGDFGALAKANSADPGSAEKGGDLGFFAEGMMVKPFNDACFGGKKGDMVLVQSDFGFHIINITDQKGRKEVAKFATIANKIEPSTETYRDVYARAGKFVSATKDAEAFEKNIEEQGLVKRSAEVLRVNDRSVAGMENSREMVRWAFRSEQGAVSSVFEIGDKYVVASLAKVVPKGVKAFEDVQTDIETKVKREKKAEQLLVRAKDAIKKGGSDMDAIARAAEGIVQQFGNATFQSNFLSGIGREPALSGVIFSMEAGKMSDAVKGERGVYIVAVDGFFGYDEKADLTASKQTINNQLASRAASESFNAKKELITLEDNRHLFY